MKRLYAFFFLGLLFPVFAMADTIVLKNGMRFDSKRVWEENGEIKCMVKGLIVGFPKNDVDHINKTKDAKTHQGSEYTFKATRKDLEQTRKELENEYKALLEELDDLSNDKPEKMNGEEIRNHDAAVILYNKKVAEYEKKRKAYIAAVERYHKRIDKPIADGTMDKDSFEKLFASWVGGAITDFIDEWGNPDTTSDAPNNQRAYLFVIEITPSNTRNIYFTTNSSGKIVDYRSGETKKE